MKKTILTVLILQATLLAFGQTSAEIERQNAKQQAFARNKASEAANALRGKQRPYPDSKLSVNQTGLQIFVAVLFYNDSTILAVQPIENLGQVNNYKPSENGWSFRQPRDEEKILSARGSLMIFKKDRLKVEQVLDLVTKNGFVVNGDYLVGNIGLQDQYTGTGECVKNWQLPPYLKFSIERVRLK